MAWARIVWDAARRFVDDEGLMIAGNMAFSALLSLFPFIIFLVALAGFMGDEALAAQLTAWAFERFPADVADALAPALSELVTTRRRGLLTFGIVFALWTASGGVESLRIGLNRAYDVRADPRPLWHLRLQSMVCVAGGGIILLVAIGTIVVAPVLWQQFVGDADLSIVWPVIFTALRFVIGATALGGGILILHLWLPANRLPTRRLLPGVVVTVALWLAVASAFSAYLTHVGDYSVTYGSLGGVIAALMFFYLSGAVFVFGGEFNMALHHRLNGAT